MVEPGTVDDSTVAVPTLTYVFNGLFLFIMKLVTDLQHNARLKY